MSRRLKTFVERMFNKLGFSVRRQIRHGFYEPYFSQKIELILDVGANSGQFALSLRGCGYKSQIVSFEPLSEAYEKLRKNSASDQRWEVYDRCAIGEETGEVTIFQSFNSYSSSILKIMPAHLTAAHDSRITGSEQVPVLPLEKIYSQVTVGAGPVALKIDTQGYEMKVLKGLGGYLKNVSLVQLELSIVELYEKQELALEYFEFFSQNGFEIWSLKPGFTDPQSGRMLQFDAIFVNSSI